MKREKELGRAALVALAITLLCVFSLSASTAVPDKSKRPVKKSAAVTAARRTSKPVASASVHSSRRSASGTRTKASSTGTTRASNRVVIIRKKVNGRWVRTTRVVRAAPPAATYQLHPDPDRYQQIQQSLAAGGYFKGQVNGQWGDDSVDALKRFQTDHNLPNDGKINSLSLINLGLGPRHDDASATTAAQTSTAVPSPDTPSPPLAQPASLPLTPTSNPN